MTPLLGTDLDDKDQAATLAEDQPGGKAQTVNFAKDHPGSQVEHIQILRTSMGNKGHTAN